MTVNLPDNVQPYPNISSKAYEHPADRAATAALKSVPMLDTVVRKLIELRYERALRQFYLGNSVKVSERQLPELWAAHQRRLHGSSTCPSDYDLYVDAVDRRHGAGDRLQASRCSSSTRRCWSGWGPASSARCSATSWATSSPTTCST